MPLLDADLTVELIPHCESVARAGWTASHDVRPLSDLGHRQAAALVSALGDGIDAIYSSPTARCRQTVGPLAAATGLQILDLAELYEAGDFSEPAAAEFDEPNLMVHAIGGAWAAGRMIRGLETMLAGRRGGRVVAASHGDVIPVLIAALSNSYGVGRPEHVGRGGWYTLLFRPGSLTLDAHDPVTLTR
jgi:8-oxo-dGTP diphosphatase